MIQKKVAQTPGHPISTTSSVATDQCKLPAGLDLRVGRGLRVRLRRRLDLPAAERLQAELGELLRGGAVVLLDGVAQQRRQPRALGEHSLELLRLLLLARPKDRLLLGEVHALG